MSRRPVDPSVTAEPQLVDERHEADPSEVRAVERLARDGGADERHEHTVWDEPGLSSELAGRPGAGQTTWRRWLAEKRASTGLLKTWGVTLGVALAAGPWAVLGALWSGRPSVLGVMAVVVFGPLAEEVLKVAAALVVVERRPYLFRWGFQIVLCALAAGFAFAAIENVIYLKVYVPDPPQSLVVWRWSVCVALHTGCSLIAGIGVARAWRDAMARGERVRLSRALPGLLTAVVLHGAYNLAATLIEALGDPVW